MNGGMLDMLPNFRPFEGGDLGVVSFKIVDVSNGLFLGVEYLVVELNGVVDLFSRLSKVLFHVVFGRLRLISFLQFPNGAAYLWNSFVDLL